MAKVSFATVSAGVLKNDEGRILIEHPLTIIHLNNIPNNYTFNFTYGLIDVKLDEKYKINIELIDNKTNSVLVGNNFDFEMKRTEGPSTKYLMDVTQSFLFSNVQFFNDGRHTMKLKIDDEDEFEIYFNVEVN